VITFYCSHLCRLIIPCILVELVGAFQSGSSFIVSFFSQISNASIILWVAGWLCSKHISENLVTINVETSGYGFNMFVIAVDLSKSISIIAGSSCRLIFSNIYVDGCFQSRFIRNDFSKKLLKIRLFTWTNSNTRINSCGENKLS